MKASIKNIFINTNTVRSYKYYPSIAIDKAYLLPFL